MIFHIQDISHCSLEFCVDEYLCTHFWLDRIQDRWVPTSVYDIKGRYDITGRWAATNKKFTVLNKYSSIEELMKDQFERFL